MNLNSEYIRVSHKKWIGKKDSFLAIPRKILKMVRSLYVVVSRNSSLVVITTEKINYHMNTVGYDLLNLEKQKVKATAQQQEIFRLACCCVFFYRVKQRVDFVVN